MTYMTAKEMETKIKSIALRGKNLDTDIHETAVSTLAHIEAHGDVTLANRLLVAMPKAGRKAALMGWMLAMGKVVKNSDKATMELSPLKYDKAGETDLDTAQAVPFWDWMKELAVPKAWSYDSYMKRVLKTLQDAALEDTVDGRKAKAAIAELAKVQA